MDTLLWLASSLVMAGLLVCLAVRAVKGLLLPEGYGLAVDWKHLAPSGWPWPVLFCGSLAGLWRGTLVA